MCVLRYLLHLYSTSITWYLSSDEDTVELKKWSGEEGLEPSTEDSQSTALPVMLLPEINGVHEDYTLHTP